MSKELNTSKPLTNNLNKGKGSRIFRNFGYLAVGKLLGDGFTFLFFIVLARTYSQEGLGQYSFAMALTGVLFVCADFGLFNRSIKDMSRNEAELAKYCGKLLAIRLLLAATLFLVLFLISSISPFSQEMQWIILLIGVYQIGLALVHGFGAVFVAREDMYVAAAMEFSLRTTTALTGMAIALMDLGLVLAIASLPLMTIIHVGIGYILVVRRYGLLSLSVKLQDVQKILRDAWPYAAHNLLKLLSSRITLIFIGFMLGATAAGVFNAAYRVIVLLVFIISFAGIAVFPVASRLYASSREQVQLLYRKTLNVAILLGVPMAAGIWLITPQLIEVLYGAEFAESAGVLRWLSGLIIIVFLRTVMEYFLIACDFQKQVTAGYLLVACFGVPLHMVLIANWGISGAAMAILGVETLLALFMGINLSRSLGWPLSIEIRAMASVIASATFVIPILIYQPSLVLTIPTAVVIYTAIVFLFSDIRNNELQMLTCYFSAKRRV